MEGDPLNFRPPVLVGERVAWMGSGSGLPQGAFVRWIGRVPEITNGWTVGIELDRPMPVGGIDGTWRKRKLFSCEPKHGLLVPIDKIVKESSLLQTRHSLGESFYSEGGRPLSEGNKALLRQLSLPQSQNSQEFLSRVLPASNKTKKSEQDATALKFKEAANKLLEDESSRSLLNHRKPGHAPVNLEREAALNEVKLTASRQRAILRTFSLEKPKIAPLSVENVKSFEESGCATVPKEKQDWAATFEEWERFKKYLDNVGNIPYSGSANHSQRKKVGENPSSLYALAKTNESLFETPLALRLIGERKEPKRTELVIKEESFEKTAEDQKYKERHSANEIKKLEADQLVNNLCKVDKSNKINADITTTNGQIPIYSDVKKTTEFKNIAGKQVASVDENRPGLSINSKEIALNNVSLPSGNPELKKQNSTDLLIKNTWLEVEADVTRNYNLKEGREKANETVFSKDLNAKKGSGILKHSSSELLLKPDVNIQKASEKDAFSKETDSVKVEDQNPAKLAPTDLEDTSAFKNESKKLQSDKKKEKTDSAVQTAPTRTKKQLRGKILRESKSLELPEQLEVSTFESLKEEEFLALEVDVESYCDNLANVGEVEVLTSQEVEQSVPAPTLRRKRQPVPTPRRKPKEDRQDDETFDTASVLYEPAFLRAYCDGEPLQSAMTDIQGTFRRIEEDDIDRPIFQNRHRVLSASVSAPETNKKGLFSFLRWFKRSKHVEDLDLNALNAASVASSPVFPRTDRLNSAESVDTLYSIATASSFAFVPASQYQREHSVVPEPRKKRRAPQPPLRRDASLPNTLEYRGRVSHRRTASESYKDKRLPHVHGKRRAPPPPPVAVPRLYPTLSSVRDPYPSLLKKKRPAPLPPDSENAAATAAPLVVNSSLHKKEEETVVPVEETPPAESNNNGPSSIGMGGIVSDESVVSNDTLKLERGVLKPNRTSLAIPDVTKVIPLSPVSPRPWYKRKSLEKRKEKVSGDWMPEVGFSRPGISPDISPLKLFFTRGNDEKKKEEKRKSGISILANISELDREAAEICKRDQEQQQQKLAATDAKFYDDPLEIGDDGLKKNSTRELISLFNNIGSVTKVSVNPQFFARNNGIVSPKKLEISEKDVAVGVASTPEIKMAALIGTKDFINDEPKPSKLEVVEDTEPENNSKSQAMFDARLPRHPSPSPTISTIAEVSEPSSSAATTMNQYAEHVWKCARCTLENAHWRNRCDACSACKPNYNPIKNAQLAVPFERRKSEMDLEIDWEQELQKYFPAKTPPKDVQEISSKLILSKSGDVEIKTETSQMKEGFDIDEVRKRRMAFFLKSLGNEVTSIRDAASKKSLDETEKLKLKGMLKEMKESLPKREVINNASTNSIADAAPDVVSLEREPPVVNGNNEEAARYGAIRKFKKDEPKKAEALLITTTTVFEDIIVKKKNEKAQQTSPVVEIPVHNFTTVQNGNNQLKKARRIGDGPFELMKARDLASIIQTKTGVPFPAHVYANIPAVLQKETNGDLGEDQLTTLAGLAKFKASLDPAATNTIAVNRLLRKLEGAIADGRHDQAAALARDLAVLKVSCSVIRQKPSPSPPPTAITVEMYVEDKVSHQGPIPLQVQRSMTLSQLKTKIQNDFQIPSQLQRWILGKSLATDEAKTLEELGVTEDRCPIFLYLVAPEPEHVEPKAETTETIELEDSAGATGENPPENSKNGPPRGKGWYYNYEEDRYSFCESDSDKSPEKEIPVPAKVAAKKIIQRTIDAARGASKSVTPPIEKENVEKKEPVVAQPVVISKPYQPRGQRPPLLTSQSLPERDLPEEKQESAKTSAQNSTVSNPTQAGTSGVAANAVDDIRKKSESPQPATSEGPARPRSRSIFDLMKPQSNDTLKKDLKMISVNVKETIEMLSRRGEDINRQGWRCAVCTLVNTATRPGCAACMSARPPGYAPPPLRPVEQELRRLRRDQSLDIPLREPDAPASGSQTYLQLVNLDNAGVVPNAEEFECPVCMTVQAVGEGVVLRECLHNFCKACLQQTIQYNEEAEVTCPFRDNKYTCESVIQEREIKALVPPEIWEQHLTRSVSQAENKIGNTFHCKTPDCRGWCIVEDNVNEYRCPVCRHNNCLTCQTIHEGLDCRQYQERLKNNSDTDAEAKRTRNMLEDMVQRGDAMACPTCQVVLMKKWGCDWLRCSMCKTEICWVTRGPRWGPAGKGDTSAGCQCGINGVKCHPKCNYCH